MTRMLLMSILFSIYIAMFVPRHIIHPELEQYRNDFLQRLEASCPSDRYNVPDVEVVTFQKLGRPVVGYCMSVGNGFRVYIDKKFFDSSSETDRYILMVHELSHCYLGLQHEETVENHYMNPTLPDITKETANMQLDQYLRDRCQI